MAFKDNIKVRDRLAVKMTGKGGSTEQVVPRPPPLGIMVESNVRLTLRDEPDGKIRDERRSHNLFVNYGREWISELISLNTGPAAFRSDHIHYFAFGIGGTKQLLSPAIIQGMYAGWSGFTTPVQTNTDPTVTGLEFPVEIDTSVYYDPIALPATFPEAGTSRYSAILGYLEVSYSGGPGSIPLTEIGMFTEGVADLSVSPVAAPPERFMVAYNTFDVLSKTSDFVLQVDWELRFS